MPLQSAVNVLSTLLTTNPELQKLYITTKTEGGKVGVEASGERSKVSTMSNPSSNAAMYAYNFS